jgi:hypothetical protein
MKSQSRVKWSLVTPILFAALLAASSARAEAPRGWDFENDRPLMGERPMVIHYGQALDPYRDETAAAEGSDRYVAGSGSGETTVDKPLDQDSKDVVAMFFSKP